MPKDPNKQFGDPRVKDPATRKALGYASVYGEWKGDTYVPREGVKIPAEATHRKTDDATGKERKTLRTKKK